MREGVTPLRVDRGSSVDGSLSDPQSPQRVYDTSFFRSPN